MLDVSEIDNSGISSEPIDVALAIDIGGSKMAVGLVNRRGDMLDREIARTDKDKNANDLFEILAVLIKRQLARAEERHGGKVVVVGIGSAGPIETCLLYTSPSPRDGLLSRMPSSA